MKKSEVNNLAFFVAPVKKAIFAKAISKGMNFFSPYNKQIASLCQQYNVRHLFAFGSVLTDRFNEQSDVDLIVDFDKQAVKDHFLNFFDFKYSIENLLHREVDLLEEQPIRNSYLRKNIENSKVLVYGR